MLELECRNGFFRLCLVFRVVDLEGLRVKGLESESFLVFGGLVFSFYREGR